MLPFILVTVMLTSGLPAQEQSPPDLSTPGKTLAYMVSALNADDFPGIAKCVIGAKPTAALDGLRELQRFPYHGVETTTMEYANADVKIDGDSATITLNLAMRTTITALNASRLGFSQPDHMKLRRLGSDWKVVPADIETLQSVLRNPSARPPTSLPEGTLGTLASMCVIPEVFLSARRAAVGAQCHSRARIVALCILMYVQDHELKFSIKQSSFKQTLLPYYAKIQRELAGKEDKSYPRTEAEISRELAFHCPMDPSDNPSFSLNSRLENVSLPFIPSHTVIVYEGKNDKLDLRHGGKAAVGFIDGKVEMVDEAASKKLNWTLTTPAPAKPAGKVKKKNR